MLVLIKSLLLAASGAEAGQLMVGSRGEPVSYVKDVSPVQLSSGLVLCSGSK